MAAPKELKRLVENFDRNLTSYRSGAYNEAQVRVEFVDPMFELLGWDVQNKAGHAEAYKDVIHEDAIQIGGTTKAPDYCFRIGGARKFFLEAKKPSVSIKSEPTPAYQLRRYAWSAKLPLSLLSDFAELAVYDCRVKPEKTDKPAIARINYLTYDTYPSKWDEIAGVFSKDAVLKGSFDRFAEEKKAKRGTAAVDAEFLKEIERWRDVLARNIALRNPRLSIRELNEAVQRTIDRIVFLRICEDRGIETQYPLQGLQNGANVYRRLFELFQRADERYNSGLFHFQKEKGFTEAPDTLTPGLKIDDKPLQDIIANLYYPDSPYEFSVLPADILGQVYEQFLGKVIRLTPAHRAVVEDKPEVKKAGGVYYTPTYIVDYIVEHTVGELLKENTPKQAADLKILDPACGSGSFVLGAYQRLLDWHRDWYLNDGPDKFTRPRKGEQPALFQAGHGEWRLTTAERKRILLNSIFGVDIDPQAVEVTKLSLLLKVLEGESDESISSQLKLFHQRALPDLGSNIKCGNSLIGSDFFQGRQGDLFDDDEALRVNPFDWDKGFPEIFTRARPGFDAVIGNPPYVSAWELYSAAPAIREYFNNSPVFATADRHWDLYVLFLERAHQLSRVGGRFAFIIPFSYAIQKYALVSRRRLLSLVTIESVADLRRILVFEGVPVITLVPVFINRPASRNHQVVVRRPVGEARRAPAHTICDSHTVSQKYLLDQHESMWRLDATDKVARVLEKIETRSTRLAQLCYVNYGAQMSSREKGKFGKAHVIRSSRASRSCRPMVSGRELYRYSIRWAGRFVDWSLAPEMYGPRWPGFFETSKLMVRDITGTHRIEATLDTAGFYCDHTILCALRKCDIQGERTFTSDEARVSEGYDLRYLAAVVASSLVSAYYYLKLTGEGVRVGGGFHTYPKTLSALPICVATDENARQRETIARQTDRMLALHRKLAAARTDHEKTVLQRQIDATDREIDQLVYELYGLTDEEIRIVEGAT